MSMWVWQVLPNLDFDWGICEQSLLHVVPIKSTWVLHTWPLRCLMSSINFVIFFFLPAAVCVHECANVCMCSARITFSRAIFCSYYQVKGILSTHPSSPVQSLNFLIHTIACWGELFQNKLLGFQGGAVVKNLPANVGDARDVNSIPGWGDPWRRKWQPIPLFLPGKFHGQRNLVGYSPWSFKESDTTEWQHTLTQAIKLWSGLNDSEPGVSMLLWWAGS